MKDYKKALRIGYWNLLQGLIYGGKVVPAYDGNVPSDAPDNYLNLVNQSGRELPRKDRFFHNADIRIHVVTKFKSGFGNSNVSDDIANLVLQLAIPAPGKSGVTLFPEFRIVTTTLEGDKKLEPVDDGTQRTIHRYLTISHRIQEL